MINQTLGVLNNNVINPSFHNFSPHQKIPQSSSTLLGLGNKFCIQTKLPHPNLRKSFSKFSRAIRLKAYVIASKLSNDLDYNPKLYEPSTIKPPLAKAQIESALNRFICKIKSASNKHSKKAQYNLTKLQRRTLKQLKDNQQITILKSDKNLGIAMIKREEYIKAIPQEHLTKNDI